MRHSPNPEKIRRPRKPQSLLDEILSPLVVIVVYLEFWLGMYVQAMRTARPQDDPYLRPWKVARDATWFLLLVAAYLQYYFMDVQAQIAALPTLDVRV
ncbi:MAG: hypothetical protein A3H27_17460 [Acidobacteria bacterium RIFCSPLOWO2_02_FULL_59_13]|nr:MAG: hypothetical protein A3H27_17460 [Acidobacteria bacterium RIFCSPLOWO2_02_FULL_59_13]